MPPVKLRFGFIGIGAMGLTHLDSFQKLCRNEIEVAAVCSSNSDHIRKARELAPGLNVVSHPEDLINGPVDVIVVSTPNFTHVPLALEILRAGKHLFLEKPCGITADECRRLVEAADQTECIVMVGHELRYSPYFARIKQMVDAGEIGTPHMVWCREFRGPFQKKSQDWIQDARRSGGTLVDKSCHHFDLMNWWADSRPARVAAFGGCAVNRMANGGNEVHDHVTMSFEYENGIRGTHQLCMFARDFPEEELEMGIVGSEGVIQTRVSDLQILQWRRGEAGQPRVHSIAAKRGEGWGAHLGMDEIHVEFVRCIVEGRQPLTGVRACVDGTLLAIAAEESIRTGKVTDV
jgi:predicted dehydrogenase